MFEDLYTQARNSDHKAAKAFRYVISTPPWVYSITMALGTLIVIIPVLILIASVVAALVMMAICFYTLNLINGIIRMIMGSPDASGRKNVKVIEREGQSQG